MGIKHYFQEFSFGDDEPTITRLADMLARSSAELVSIGRDPLTQTHPNDVNIRGSYSSLSIEDDIHYFSCDMLCETPFETRGMVPAGLWVGALFNGEMLARFGERKILFSGNGQAKVVSFGGPQEFLDRPTPQQRIRMASFLVAEEFLDRQLLLNADAPIAALKALITPGVHVHPMAHTDILSETLLRLFNSPYRGQTERLFLESTVIATVFQLQPMQRLKVENGTARLRKPLADLAFEARQLIDDCPERFQSIRALAAELNTNETTLQRQFKAKFDLTVFQYVLARRMQAARILIKDGHLQIAEVAYRVGYNSPANFSTAYRRYYGHAPQDERSKS